MLIDCPSCTTSFRVAENVLGAGRQVRCASCRNVWFATPDKGRAEPAMTAEAVNEPPRTISAPKAPAEPVPDTTDDDWGAAFNDEAKGKQAANPPPAPDEKVDAAAEIDLPVTKAPPTVPEDDGGSMPVRTAAAGRDSEPSPRPRPGRMARPDAVKTRRLMMPKRPSMKLSWPVLVVLAGAIILTLFFTGREQVVRTMPQAADVYAGLGVPVNLRGIEFQNVRGSNETADGVTVLVVEGKLVNITPRTIELPRLRLSVRDAAAKEIYTWTATAPRPSLGPGEVAEFRSRLASPPADGKAIEVRFFTRQDAGGR